MSRKLSRSHQVCPSSLHTPAVCDLPRQKEPVHAAEAWGSSPGREGATFSYLACQVSLWIPERRKVSWNSTRQESIKRIHVEADEVLYLLSLPAHTEDDETATTPCCGHWLTRHKCLQVIDNNAVDPLGEATEKQEGPVSTWHQLRQASL
jgi:hypothetical protein